MENIKITVEARRVQMDLTQKQLANKLNMSTSTYIQKAKKRVEWKGSELIKIRELSGVSLDALDF